MLTFDNDSIQFTESLIDMVNQGEFKFHDTDFKIFMVLKHLDSETEHSKPLFYDEGVERYIELLYL